MRRLLMTAFHFPPLKGSSGLLRTLGFCSDLRSYGWLASVVSAHARAYPRVSDELVGAIPPEVGVRRAFALDAARHLAVFGKYPDWLAIPDRWWPWVGGAVVSALAEIRKSRPELVWSTYPIASAHLVGYIVHRLSGLPWVADFRDPMVERDARTGAWFPVDERLRRVRLAVERLCARHAARTVFCTESARRIFTDRHGGETPERSAVIANGYDEGRFQAAEARAGVRARDGARAFTLVHSGVLYPTSDRDPTALFDALGAMKRSGALAGRPLRVVLRASGSEPLYRQRIEERDVADVVELAPAIDHVDALAEMLDADGLLIVQGYTSDPAIPAKLYEYLRAGKPILALAHQGGESARLIERTGAGVVADPESPEAIEDALRRFVAQVRDGELAGLPPGRVTCFCRSERARELARLLDELGGSR